MAEEDDEDREDEKPDPEAAARRRLALAQIRQYGDPVLRMQARPVERFDGDLERTVERMTLLMQDAQGVGLAATQVGILQRLFVLDPGKDGKPRALVNPRIVERGKHTETADEGCLSLQGVHVPVERDVKIVVEAQDEHGDPVRLELEELPARVAQHELDHLDGTLIIDRTDPEHRREALAVLRPKPYVA